MIFLVVSLIGTASPRPTPATAVLIPTTWPCPSASAPPELPGLRAASVWITFSTIRPAARERTGSERPSADTTPAVTEPAKPCGFPIATTSCPTRRFSASPSTPGVKSVPSARSTARSESGSVPTTSTPTSEPSTKEARTPAVPLATTCAEVSMKPSGVTTKPLPPPSIRRPPRTRRETRRLATEGERRSATAMTAREYASRTSSSAGTSCDEMNVRSTTVPS